MEPSYTCIKHNITVSDECTHCRDPEIYCKFRSSCPIWFIDRRGGESIDEDKAESFVSDASIGACCINAPKGFS